MYNFSIGNSGVLSNNLIKGHMSFFIVERLKLHEVDYVVYIL